MSSKLEKSAWSCATSNANGCCSISVECQSGSSRFQGRCLDERLFLKATMNLHSTGAWWEIHKFLVPKAVHGDEIHWNPAQGLVLLQQQVLFVLEEMLLLRGQTACCLPQNTSFVGGSNKPRNLETPPFLLRDFCGNLPISAMASPGSCTLEPSCITSATCVFSARSVAKDCRECCRIHLGSPGMSFKKPAISWEA